MLLQCPNSYFDNWLFELYQSYCRIKVMKELGISIYPENISIIEVDAMAVIEIETQKARDKFQEIKSHRESKKHGNKSRPKN